MSSHDLRIKTVKHYTIPVYPEGIYKKKPADITQKAVKTGAISASIIALLQGCDWLMPTKSDGGIQFEPIITETNAREIIEDVFSREGIILDNDIPLSLNYNDSITVDFEVDGYNDSLRVGYEYISEDDSYTGDDFHIYEATEKARHESGPFIKSSRPIREGYEEYLEQMMEVFIDSLRSEGII